MIYIYIHIHTHYFLMCLPWIASTLDLSSAYHLGSNIPRFESIAHVDPGVIPKIKQPTKLGPLDLTIPLGGSIWTNPKMTNRVVIFPQSKLKKTCTSTAAFSLQDGCLRRTLKKWCWQQCIYLKTAKSQIRDLDGTQVLYKAPLSSGDHHGSEHPASWAGLEFTLKGSNIQSQTWYFSR